MHPFKPKCFIRPVTVTKLICVATLVWITNGAVLWAAGQQQEAASGKLRLMTFNVRLGVAEDGPNHWDLRKPLVAQVIRDFAADLVGTQETFQFQADYLLEQLPEYAYFGRSRMLEENEHCGILYRVDRFDRLAGGHFWLSESPTEPASRGWDAALPRMATWMLLRDRPNSETLLVVNTHFDHVGQEARRQSARLIAEQAAILGQLDEAIHVIILGDFNTAEGTEPHQTLLATMPGMRDTYRDVHLERAENEATFHGWRKVDRGNRIDWILIGPTLVAKEAEIVRWSQDGRLPSDHFPVTAVVQYARKISD